MPLERLLASTPFPTEAPDEFRSTAPALSTMSSVPATPSPALSPGFPVFELGRTRVMVRATPGLMVSRLMLTIVDPPGRLTV